MVTLKFIEVLKNTFQSQLYWVLFPKEDLRQAVETAKRILTKEKIDRQLASQFISTPFMNINDNIGCNNRNVSFDNHNVLDTKVDKPTALMSELNIQNKESGQAIKSLRFIKEKGKVGTVTITMTVVDSKTKIGQVAQIHLEGDHADENHSLDIILGGVNLRS